MVGFYTLIVGIICIIVGFLGYKFPKQYLEIFGARILVLLPKEKRPKVIKVIGVIMLIIGTALVILSLA